MSLAFDIIGICLLTIPFIWEVYNDRHGDAHITRGPLERYQVMSKTVDVMVRFILTALGSLANHLLTGASFWASFILSGSIHFLVFDYTVAYVLIRNKVVEAVDWFDLLGSKGIDNISLWREMAPVNRLIIRLLVFFVTCTIYYKCS